MAKRAQPSAPSELQPRQADFPFDLDDALGSMVELKSRVPADAFTAETLGRERRGHGVVVNADGLVLTIGYLIIEAETVWLTTGEGRIVQGHALAFDPVSGFGLVQALAPLDVPIARFGMAAAVQPGDRLVIAGAGGRSQAIVSRLVARQEFAGYWEYLLEAALFVAPSHPDWGGAGAFDETGRLIGIGSLQIEQSEGRTKHFLNMVVPIDLLTPVMSDLVKYGRAQGPARPWLGLYVIEMGERLVIAGVADGGPSSEAGVEGGDILMAVAGERPRSLADLWRKIWSLGPAGVEIPLLVERDARIFETRVKSVDRLQVFKAPILH